jgi:hypothetical protein
MVQPQSSKTERHDPIVSKEGIWAKIGFFPALNVVFSLRIPVYIGLATHKGAKFGFIVKLVPGDVILLCEDCPFYRVDEGTERHFPYLVDI